MWGRWRRAPRAIDYVRSSTGAPLYSWTAPSAAETIIGTPQWTTVGGAHYLYVATNGSTANSGKIYRLIDNGSTSLTVDAAWGTADPYPCACTIQSPLSLDASNLYWAGSNATPAQLLYGIGQTSQGAIKTGWPITTPLNVTTLSPQLWTKGGITTLYMGIAGDLLQLDVTGTTLVTNTKSGTVIGRVSVGTSADPPAPPDAEGAGCDVAGTPRSRRRRGDPRAGDPLHRQPAAPPIRPVRQLRERDTNGRAGDLRRAGPKSLAEPFREFGSCARSAHETRSGFVRNCHGGALSLLLLLPACGSVTASAPGKDASGGDALTDGDVDVSGHLAPVVSATDPSAAATEVVLNRKVSATFSEAMKASTLNAATFTLKQGTAAVAGAVSTVGSAATFAPSSNLAPGTTFTATITTGATDLAGNPLAVNYVWSFTTAACAATPVALGAAATFAVLAGSTVANTGASSILGDVGVSPGTALTGFPPGTIVGFQHAGDATAASAAADLSAAYDDASARSLCVIPIAGDLGGRKLLAGLYNSISSLAITSDDLTLDAQGDGDAVFIFQMATTLTTASQVKINLSGGAKASNVFWQVGSSATLGAMSTFEGTILAAQSVTVSSGATVDGRVLARTAAVVLSTSTIVEPTP